MNGPDSITSVEMVPVRAAAISAGSQPVSAKTVPATRHRDEEKPVRAAAAEAVAVAGEQDGDERGAREQSREHDADLGGGETAARERDADQDRAEPVGQGARSLAGDDPACVRAQACSSNTAAPPLPGQKT